MAVIVRVSKTCVEMPLRNQLTMILFVGAAVGNALGQDCTVRTIFRAIDKHGQPAMTITPDRIKAEISGIPANVDSLSAAKPDVILMVDVSSSMKDVWNQVIEAANQLLERAGGNVVVVAFGEEIYGHATGRVSSKDFLNQLSKHVYSGRRGTALYDSLIEVASHVTSRDAAIVIISDGEDDMSRNSSDQTVTLFLKSSWPPVFGLILDYSEGGSHGVRRYFKKISTATGGAVLYAPSASKVSVVTDGLTKMVLNSFDVVLQPAQSLTNPARLKLEAIGSQGREDKEISLLHVAEIAGCDSQQSAHH
jgi:hypothetical protein